MKKQAMRLLFAAAVMLFVSSGAWSQGIFSTITGVVADPTGAVIPGAQVTLQNATSGSTRVTVADHQGLYTFASVPVGTYNLSATREGFQAFREQGIALGGGETRTINVSLQVGSATQSVQVNAEGDLLTPVNSGEQVNTLSTQQLQNYVQTGSNAAEFIKIMPGFGIQNGVSNQSAYTGEVIGINANGNGGSQSPLNNAFTYNGLPGNTLDIVSDGAHVSDPGCNCDTPVNPNSDFLQEFRVMSSDYSAEEQKGPMVITSVTKAGGSQFHGEGFFSARNYVLNSNDAYNKALGAERPTNKYYYSGGDIGGPVLPDTHLRDKFFFFTGFEYFYQVLDTGVLTATVPTADIISGDFSPASLAALGTKTASGAPPGTVPSSWSGGQMPAGLIDPSMQALMKLYPKPNADPNATGGFNYVQQEIFNQNNTQLVVRGDYDVSQNTKIWARWNWQTEIQPSPVGLWEGGLDQVPYPTDILGRNRSNSLAATITHVFSPTLTNEGVFAWTRILFPNVFSNPSAVNPTSAGYNDPTLFNHATPTDQIPNFAGLSGTPSEAATVSNQGGFYLGGPSQGLFADKWMPSFSDTLTKVWGTHTLAAGMFYEWIKNSQPDSSPSNGSMQYYPGNNPAFTYGDAYADMLAGNLSSYSEENFNRLNAESYWTLEGFAQDTWLVNPKLTLNYGVRFTHFEPWVDDLGFGFSTFNPSLYSSANNGACAKGPTFCGFEWHSRNSATPLGGFPTRALFYQPRIGASYDIRGNGSTMIRGGWGYFFYHTGQFTSGLTTAAGEEGITLTPATIGNQQLLAKNLGNATFTAVPSTPGAVNSTDDQEPYTMDYNVSLEQRLPWSSMMGLTYIGNVSRDLVSNAGYGSNINLVPLGAMLSASNPGLANPNNYRPYVGYSDLNQVVNNIYTNYNSLQLKYAHQSAKMLLQLNYTWAKALGVAPCATATLTCGATMNPFNLRANYGALSSDRRQLFNAVYNFDLPGLPHGNKFVGGVVNGWQLSGITQLQSGANLTANAGQAFNMNLNGAVIPGSISSANPKGIPINSQSILGTPNVPLHPIVTCNLKSGLPAHEFVNSNCLAAPTTVGINGPAMLPAVYGPAYFGSDLGIFKNFHVGSREASRLQVRVEAQNFLNHPLYSFPNTNNLKLNYVQASPGSSTITQTNTDFGQTTYKQGHRIVKMEMKYYF